MSVTLSNSVLVDKKGMPAEEYFDYGEYTTFMGGVYFIQGVDGGPIKIGWSKYPPESSRLEALQSGSPVKLRVIGVVTGTSVRLENSLHDEFKDDRLHGEWFEPTDRLLALIKKWAWQY